MKIYYESKSDELIHYGVPGMKWGITRSTSFTSTSRRKLPVGAKEERYKKTERQKRYEDDNGINPHRPNGTKPKLIFRPEGTANRFKKKHPKIAKANEIINRILENANRYGRKY